MKKKLAIDIGFKDIKAVYQDENGNLTKLKFSAILAIAPEEAEDMPLLEGKRYFYDKTALMRDSKDIIEVADYKSLEKTSPIFIWIVFKKLNLKLEDVDVLITGLSLAHVEYANAYRKRITKFKIGKEIFDFSEKLVFVPQGVGAKYLISHNFKESPTTYLIVDIGSLTIDVVDVVDGYTRKENLKGFPNEGIIKISRALQEHIVDTYSEHLSIKEVNELITTRQLVIEGTAIDLSEIVNKLSKEYSERTYKLLRNRYEREFKRYPKIYFVGGGAYFFDKSISNAIEILEEPEYYNVMGYIYSQQN